MKYQEAAELLARKAQISSEEARLQGEKALEIESQLERCKYEMNRVCSSWMIRRETGVLFWIELERRRKAFVCPTNQ